MTLLSIGIDPGSSNGAIGVIDQDLNIIKLVYAPYYIIKSKTKQNKRKLNKETNTYEKDYRSFKWSDFKCIGDILRPYSKDDVIYTIERVGSRKGEGEHSSFIFGNSMGVFQGQYSMLNPVSYYEPHPTQWKSELGVTSDKSTSVELANKIFGDSLKNLKIKESDDDLYEALLLSFYGLMKYAEDLELKEKESKNGKKINKS